MSLTNPDKFDNIIGNIEIIKYFVGLLEKNILLYKELTDGIYK